MVWEDGRGDSASYPMRQKLQAAIFAFASYGRKGGFALLYMPLFMWTVEMFKFTVMVLVATLLAGCSRETPEEAKQKLEKMKVAQTPEALLASTKTEKSEKTAELLVTAGVDPNARQANGMTVLMSAVFNGQEDVAKALLEKGADVKLDAAGFNALSLAVERGNKTMVKLLLAAGADPKARPGAGLSALEKAQQQGKTELVELLQSQANDHGKSTP